jgi:hypothetical protein
VSHCTAEEANLKEVAIALLGLLTAVVGAVAAVVGAKWFAPEVLHLDALFPTKEIQIIDDFVFAHFNFYVDHKSGSPIETYQDNPVFDKVTYVEQVRLRKTNASYKIKLTSSGLSPEILAIDPPIKNSNDTVKQDGTKVREADLATDLSQEFQFSGIVPSPKLIYVYRNGFQGEKSYGGKDIKYDTDRVTFVYDFSSLKWQDLFKETPEACMKRVADESTEEIDLKWKNGVAIIDAFKLNKGDKIRIYWSWAGDEKKVTCNDVLK